MSRSVPMKFLAVLLTAAALVAACGGILGVVFLSEHNLYIQSPQEYQTEALRETAIRVADAVVERYTLNHLAVGEEEPVNSYRQMIAHTRDTLSYYQVFSYTLYSESGEELESYPESASEPIDRADVFSYDTQIVSQYPAIVRIGSEADLAYEKAYASQWTGERKDRETESEQAMEPTAAVSEENTLPEGYIFDYVEYWEGPEEDETGYHVYFLEGPTYTVHVTLEPTAFFGDAYWTTLNLLYRYRYAFIAGMVIGLLVFAAGMVYLCCAAGRKPNTEEVRLVGLNRLPLDLYLAAAGTLVFLGWCGVEGLCELEINEINYGALTLAAVAATVVAVPAILYFYALAAQVKMGNGYWWRHTLLGRLLKWMGRGIRCAWKFTSGLFRLLPLIWQWLVVAMGMFLLLTISFVWAYRGSALPLMFSVCICIGIVCYGGYAFGTLAKGVQKMAAGDLYHKVPVRYLIGVFREFGNELNALADVAVVAAKNQMQSERMKTELITNVSHDIKTPLTSIINFVDLLQKPHTEAEGEQYLEVLNRQSLRLKKLIEDLMDLSKANTGNMPVNMTEMDAVEMVNQALGEFADKLEAVPLVPVFRQPDVPVPILADGRLAWRVLSNLLTNAVKYALPGTRLYIDVVPLEGKTLISLKNISREQLNASAEELLERFVRGDTARNTEGSGLGLNIARSLMEVQRGQLQLLVDGDLFKVTLLFRSRMES